MERFQHSRPLWIGLLAATLAMPTVMSVLVSLSSDSLMIPPPLVFIVSVAISGFSTIVFALPLTLWLRKKRRLNAIWLCIYGTLAGAAVYATYVFYSNYYPEMTDRSFMLSMAIHNALHATIPGAVFGFLSACALCLGAGIAIRSKPTPP